MPEMIDRQSALSVCKEYCWLDDEDFIDGYNTAIKDIREAIKELPTIEPEVRHGRWIDWSMWGKAQYQCSECNAEMKYKTNFCPRCGAKMQDGGAENG